MRIESFGKSKFLRMELCIKVNGWVIKRMVEVSKFGLMAQDMTASGGITWPMVSEDLSMPKEMFMKANGLKIKQMAMASTLISMEVATKDIGIKTNNTATVQSSGPMVQSTKEIMNKE